MSYSQSQSHGFFWENDIKKAVFMLDPEKNNTDIHDVPAEKNRFDNTENISIKTSGSGYIGAGDIQRFFGYDNENHKNTIIVVDYSQQNDHKVCNHTYELNYNKECQQLLFGSITKELIDEYVSLVKGIPAGTVEKSKKTEYIEKKKKLEQEHGMKIIINPKVDSKSQRRVQCTIPDFKETLRDFITYKSQLSTPNYIRNIPITSSIFSPTRKRNKADFSKAQLIEICRANKSTLKGFSTLNKQNLVTLLTHHNLMPAIKTLLK